MSFASPLSVPLSKWWWDEVGGDAPAVGLGPFLGAKGAIMFDLVKLNESLKAGTDRVCRILGRDNLRKVEQNGWKGFTKKDTDADSGDSETELRETGR